MRPHLTNTSVCTIPTTLFYARTCRRIRRRARADIAGYYAHISALDHAIGKLYDAIFDAGIGEDTIFIYTSDHGDMLYSQGEVRKQKPWDESIRVPFVLHWQNRLGHCGKLFNSIDIMPTLLDLCGLPLPDSMDGRSIAPYILGEADCNDNADDIDSCDAVIIECISPLGSIRATAADVNTEV